MLIRCIWFQWVIIVKKITWKKFWSYPLAVGLFCLACAVFLSLSVFSYYRVAIQASQIMEEKKQTIILDAGHGGEDGGTVSQSGILEKDINLSITSRLKTFLVSAGFDVIMIRDSDTAIGGSSLSTVKERKASDLKKRLQIMNEHPDALFISIHQNHFEQSKYHGTQVFYSPNHESGKLLADSIQSSVVSLLQNDNMRVSKEGGKSIYLLWNSKTPSVIVECGFLSNPEEAQKLTEDNYQNQMAFSIFCGILNYCNSPQERNFNNTISSEISSNL